MISLRCVSPPRETSSLTEPKLSSMAMSTCIPQIGTSPPSFLFSNPPPLILCSGRTETIQRIRSTESDIIIFADLSQDCRSFALAHYRLAPYQLSLWGWGGTLGISSIDYHLYPQVFWYNTKCKVSNRLTTPQELFTEQVSPRYPPLSQRYM
jgi:hypothetical protein